MTAVVTWALVGELYSNSLPVRLEWNGTTLGGFPADAMDAVREYTHSLDGEVPCTPTGPWIPLDLADPVCAYVVALNVLRGADLVDGEPPAGLPDIDADLPEGAVP